MRLGLMGVMWKPR